MKKVLIYTTGGQGFQEGSQLEEAIVNSKRGNNVFYLTCGDCIGGCLENPLFNEWQCFFCSFFQRCRAKKHIRDANSVHSVNEYFSDDIRSIANSMKFEYKTVEELKSLEYKGVAIGFGAVSSYISLTRNMNPDLSNSIKKYLDRLLYQQVVLIEILYKIVSFYKPDLIVFHNGRFAQYKPVLGVAKNEKINFICTETLVTAKGVALKNFYFNNIPHSAQANLEKYDKFWNEYPQVEKRAQVACSFFENRRYGKYAGDKVYIEEQLYGKLPADWDDSKENIVFFNSSEDEFCAINAEVDKANFFGSQLEGIKSILDRYKNDTSKSFYLRIHPNLRNVNYEYHTDLYKLSYSNLSIIPPESSISSYSILDAANKIIVFGSTMGIESAYWGKPVICLGYAFYSLLGVVYVPQDKSELWSLLDNKSLKSLRSENVLKYGLFYMSDKHERFKYISNRTVIRKLGSKKWKCFSYMTLLYSDLLYKLVEGCMVKFSKPFNKLKNIPK